MSLQNKTDSKSIRTFKNQRSVGRAEDAIVVSRHVMSQICVCCNITFLPTSTDAQLIASVMIQPLFDCILQHCKKFGNRGWYSMGINFPKYCYSSSRMKSNLAFEVLAKNKQSKIMNSQKVLNFETFSSLTR